MSNPSAMAPASRPHLSQQALDFAPGLLAIQMSDRCPKQQGREQARNAVRRHRQGDFGSRRRASRRGAGVTGDAHDRHDCVDENRTSFRLFRNKPLVAEILIRNDDVGVVHPRQGGGIKLAAYPFQKYGPLDGHILPVWPDATATNSSSGQTNRPTWLREI